MSQFLHASFELSEWMTRVYKHRLTTTSGGNLSVIDEEGVMWVTPKGGDKVLIIAQPQAHIPPERIPSIQLEGGGSWSDAGMPTTEAPLHLAVYRIRKDVKAILHAHSQTLVAFSLSSQPELQVPDCSTLAGAFNELNIIMAPYAIPGSLQLAAGVADAAASGANCVVMQNHGVVCFGENMLQAYQRFVQLEFLAAALTSASSLLSKGHRIRDCDAGSLMLLLATNSLPGVNERLPVTGAEKLVRHELAVFVRRAYRQRLITAGSGSFSCRVSTGGFVVTPTGYDRGNLTIDQMALIVAEEYRGRMQPSRAWRVHRWIYECRPDVNCILIAQPPSALAYCITDAPFKSEGIPESHLVLGAVNKIPFEAVASEEDIRSHFESPLVNAALIESYGAITCGPSLLKAFDRLEVLDAMARVQLLAHQRGDLQFLTRQQVDELDAHFK